MNQFLAMVADGIYIGWGAVALIIILLLIWLVFFRGRG